MNRYFILIAAVLMQVCLGGTYAWSVFANAFEVTNGVDSNLARLPYSLFYISFPLTVLVSGLVLKKFGPRFSAVCGGVVFGLGWFLAGFGEHSFMLTVGGVGILGGIGVGLAYLVPISVGVAWFPNNRGLVTGLTVAGFGGGAAMVSQIAQYLIGTGQTAFSVLSAIGIFYVALALFSGLMMIYPENEKNKAATSLNINFSTVMKQPLFWVLFLAMTSGLTAGFFVNTNLQQFCESYKVTMSFSAVAIFAIANACGRICWGWASDHFGAGTMIRLNLALRGILIVTSTLLLQSVSGTVVLAAGAGFNYGGVLVLYASTVGSLWGNRAMSQVYGWLFASNIVAAVLSQGLGALYDAMGIISPAVVVMVLVAVSILLSLKINGINQSTALEECTVEA